ncbi:hypothetical protein D3C83_97910 [compost metagenome]
MRLLVGREVTTDVHILLGARVAEIRGRALDLDEDEVGLRIGGPVATIREPLHGEGPRVVIAL